jgi:signal transduction histidine kinase/ligand-binding sensor domain-containing protein/DNA-binding response OmpR family regulator
MKFAFTIILISIALLVPAQEHVSMNHYTTVNGLSNNTVRCIFQDSKGFMWIGTDGGGLNKFDGYRFTAYDYQGNNPHSLSNNQVQAIAEDKDGNIWVATRNGLNKLESKTGMFQRFYHDSFNANSLKHSTVSALMADTDNNLWIGTYLGLQKFNISQQTFTDYSQDLTTQDGRTEKQVTSITEDQNGNLWLGVWWGGVKKFSKTDGKFTDFWADPNDRYGLLNNNVLSVYFNQSGILWIGNHSGGIRKLSVKTGKFLPVKNTESNINVWSICEDERGRICYTRSGIGFLNPESGISELLDYSKDQPEGISSGYHYSVYCDHAGNLWLGSTEGLSLYSRLNKRFSPFMKLVDIQKRFYVTTFYKRAGHHILWLGTFGNGIIQLDENTGKYTRLFTGKNNSGTLPDNFVSHIFGDDRGQIWVSSGNGIAVLDENTGKLKKRYFYNPVRPALINAVLGNNDFMYLENDSARIFDISNKRTYSFPATGTSALPGRGVLAVFRENDTVLWIGTNLGLARYFTGSSRIESFNTPSCSIAGETIHSIFRDLHGDLWVGTQNGLNRYDADRNCFIRVAIDSTNTSVNDIVQDLKGNLWLLTEKGLTRYNPSNQEFRHYDENDGLNASNNLYKDENGMIYCNRSREGFYHFNPDAIRDLEQKPRVYITRFLLFNKEVPVSSESRETPLKTDIIDTKEIILKYNQSVFSFEFTALNYLNTGKNKFFYKLDGFDGDWYETDASHRTATYTNLNAGLYTFMVKAANSDGVPGENVATLKMIILPPPWKTWWAYALYVLTTVGLLLLFRRNLLQKENLKNKIKIEAMEFERKLKMDEMKMRFFANISHEFRTPLTLIMAPLQSILNHAAEISDQKTSQLGGLIHRNASRLTDLINQLLDIQKLEAGSLKPEICQGNMFPFLKNIFEKFNSVALQKGITYQFICPENEITGWYDPDKTDKIITNLLSNAFKFTGNRVIMEVQTYENYLHIIVEDNGRGIPAGYEQKIFERFFNDNHSQDMIQEGTGLGLSLVKELTDVLGGTVDVSSEEGKFARFRVKLPVQKELFTDFAVRTEPSITTGSLNLINEPDKKNLIVETEITKNDPLILIVEDHTDLRRYLSMVLSSKYRILEAEDGKAGLALARKHIPDLIISDILMPEMDGIEMSELLKNDEQTNHIPIVLVTSLVSTDNKLRGFETGADDYITKPFNEDLLLLRIANLIRQRKQLQRFYAAKYGLPGIALVQSKEAGINGNSEKFLARMVDLIEIHMHNNEYTNEKLASDLGMSVAVLYRKTNALLNCTPADFFRDLRIKRAIQLLGTGKLPVSEVASRVGFDDPHYFGKWFKKNYGKTPSEVMPD